MMEFVKTIEKKINSLIAAFVGNGIILMLLGILIIWTDFMLRFVMGLIVILIASTFFYGAFKIWSLKEEAKKYIP